MAEESDFLVVVFLNVTFNGVDDRIDRCRVLPSDNSDVESIGLLQLQTLIFNSVT
jgi:hypothetical protein